MCVDCKKCDREKPTKSGRAEGEIKTVQAVRNERWGFIFA